MGRGVRVLSRAVTVVVALTLVASPALNADPASAAGLPIVVNDTADLPDSSVGNGVCATAGGRCMLRAAIQEANALLGHDAINLPPGTYELEIPSAGAPIDARGIDRLFETIRPPATRSYAPGARSASACASRSSSAARSPCGRLWTA
jgi:CSLREA domain-containing protein